MIVDGRLEQMDPFAARLTRDKEGLALLPSSAPQHKNYQSNPPQRRKHPNIRYKSKKYNNATRPARF